MKTPIFKGSATALVTPFDRQGELDEPALLALIDWQLRCGTDALVVCATTGECATLSDREWSRVVSLAVERAAGRVPVIAGTGRNDTIHALRLGQEAKALGVDAVLTVTPYYNKTTQQGLLRHYLFLAEGVELPMLLYNVPSRTGMSFRAETYAALAEHPNIYGVKEASGDFGLILRTRALCPEDFALYSGNDDQIVPILAMGGEGCISVLSNVLPKEAVRLCELFFSGDVRGAAALQCRLLPVIDALFSEVNPIPVKAALAKMGYGTDTLRLPLTPMEEGRRAVLLNALEAWGV